jgi:hypothetical protein
VIDLRHRLATPASTRCCATCPASQSPLRSSWCGPGQAAAAGGQVGGCCPRLAAAAGCPEAVLHSATVERGPQQPSWRQQASNLSQLTCSHAFRHPAHCLNPCSHRPTHPPRPLPLPPGAPFRPAHRLGHRRGIRTRALDVGWRRRRPHSHLCRPCCVLPPRRRRGSRPRAARAQRRPAGGGFGS